MRTKLNYKQLHYLVLHKIQLDFSDQLFGYLWAIINPLVYIFSYWFFAYIGLRGGEVNGVPYIIWLVPGVLSYRFSVQVIARSSTMLTNNAMLIKDVDIDARMIPLIETLREVYVHIVLMFVMFIVFIIIVYSMLGEFMYLPSVYYINFIYYWTIATIYLTLLSYILSAIGVMFRDTKNIVSAIMTPLFWMTPVLYPVEHGINPLLEKFEIVLNPLYYFIRGYRNTFIYHRFFFEDTLYNLYIIIIIIIMAIFARKLWKFLMPILADLV